MTFFDKNIELIKERNIVLYDGLQLQQERMIDRVMSKLSKSGDEYLTVLCDGEWIALNSTYNPVVEAEKYAKQYRELPPYGRVLTFGFGNGYMARALMKLHENRVDLANMEDGAHIRFAFYEPDMSMFCYVMQTYDLSDILSNPDVEIFVEGLNENQLGAWCSNQVSNLNSASFLFGVLPKYQECYEDAYSRIQRVYENAKQRVQLDSNTKIAFSKLITENNLYNLRYLHNSISLLEFKECYGKQLPLLIASAGPSLKKSVKYIKELQGHVFVMAVDSAARYLIEEGITPDGIVVIDPKKDIGLFDKTMQEIPFFVHADVNHLILDKVEPRTVCFISTNLQYYEMLAMAKRDEIPCLDMGGSVATAAFSFGVYLDVDTLIFMGLDLALTGTESHVAGQNRLADNNMIKVPGNEGEELDTFLDFYMYLQWLQSMIATHPDVKVINATVGGARIEGTTYMSGDALCQMIHDMPSQTAYQRVMEYLNGDYQELEKEDVYAYIEAQILLTSKLLQMGKQLSIEGKELVRNGQIETEAFQQLNQSLEQLGNQLMGMPEFEWLESYSAGQQEQLMGNLYETYESREAELCGTYEKLEGYYGVLYDNVDAVISLCKMAR